MDVMMRIKVCGWPTAEVAETLILAAEFCRNRSNVEEIDKRAIRIGSDKV
jgi:hypothetical protein